MSQAIDSAMLRNHARNHNRRIVELADAIASGAMSVGALDELPAIAGLMVTEIHAKHRADWRMRFRVVREAVNRGGGGALLLGGAAIVGLLYYMNTRR